MSEVTYSSIVPLIEREEAQGTTMRVVFRCPVSGQQVQASALIKQGAGSRMKDAAIRSASSSARSALGHAMSSMFGGSAIGRVASSVAYQSVPPSVGTVRSSSEGERQDAVVDAFKQVASQFAWDPRRSSFVHVKAVPGTQSEFTQKVFGTLLENSWDKGVLAKMLAEIAAGDGQVGKEEREFFQGIAAAGAGSLDDLCRRPPLTAIELGETTPSARDSMLMMACAMACVDHRMERTERSRLNDFAQGLGIPEPRAQDLALKAREFVIDQALDAAYTDRRMDPGELSRIQELARSLGVDGATLTRLDVRCRKRRGIF